MKNLIFILLLTGLWPSAFAFAWDRASGGLEGRAESSGGGWDRGSDRSFSRSDSADSPRSSADWGRSSTEKSSGTFSTRVNPFHTSRERSLAQLPSRGPEGSAFRGALVSPRNMNSTAVRGPMASIARSSAFTSRVSRLNSAETIPGHYYWHRFNGYNFCHYFDSWGAHWYGWYRGDSFFWTRYFGGFWWWYDPLAFHWCYWDDGWYWQDPGSQMVYLDNGGPASPQTSNGSNGGYTQYRSEDGTRTVKMVGQDAFLFDTSGSPGFKPLFLASGVAKVTLSKTDQGKPLQIMLELNDGSFQLFDSQGQAYQ